jgi:acyl-CoA reductase-like NAD-dependent aldehyde dehydrogenase
MGKPSIVKQNCIGGMWTGENARENRSPSDLDDVVGMYAQGDAHDIDAAVIAARTALSDWRNCGIQARFDLLDKVGSAIIGRCDEIARVLAREEGKTLPEAAGEVNRAARVFKFFAGEALRISGERIDSVRPGVDIEITREPVGVVGIITAWNFPIAIPAWKIAPALAYGNTVVVKPAELTPASAHLLMEILVECGCPPGVVNLVMGSGHVVGDALLEHPQVDAISFTGSVAVGRQIITKCAATHKKVQTEMGGKNPTVILNDADLSIAIPACVNAAFGATGQRCTATSRLIVENGILNEFVHAFTKATEAIAVGHALEDGMQMGPVASEAQLNTNLKYVALARDEGADVRGGETVQRATRGFYQRPAVFLDATNEMRISREEIFGPCVSVIAARDFEQAMTLANDTPFGLSAGIITRSLKYAREFTRRAQAGMVMVNLPTAGVDYHVAFGGRKGSSYGSREQGRYAVEFYTTVKTAHVLA